jgi:hypothetical protein
VKIYLASRYSRRNEMREYAAWLEGLSYVVTSRWIHTEWRHIDDRTEPGNAPESERARVALEDFDDVADCDVLIAFSEPRDAKPTRGGKHVEVGIALGISKHIIIVGRRENVFHYLPSVINIEIETCEPRAIRHELLNALGLINNPFHEET